MALLGVVLLTEPCQGAINTTGIAFAALAAVGWASYILLTQRFAGLGGLTITVPIAAITAAIAGIPQAAGELTLGILVVAAGLAVLHPFLPFAFELRALRHMTPAAFGTLMAIEPAIGVLLGVLVLYQRPTAVQITGIVFVVIAGTAAQRGGTKTGQRPGSVSGQLVSARYQGIRCADEHQRIRRDRRLLRTCRSGRPRSHL